MITINLPKFRFGEQLSYHSPSVAGLQTKCVFIRYDYSKAVIMFENAEWAARVNPKFLSIDKQKLDYEGDGYDPDGNLVYDTAICPNCYRTFEVDYDEHSNYCPTCGAALDWQDNDTEIFEPIF